MTKAFEAWVKSLNWRLNLEKFEDGIFKSRQVRMAAYAYASAMEQAAKECEKLSAIYMRGGMSECAAGATQCADAIRRNLREQEPGK